MKQTANHKLNKPDYTDVADIADINKNMDTIDANLGKITTPTYTDASGNRYADINNMHLRTDNAIYTKGGIKIVGVDPCFEGDNLTEDMVTGDKPNLYVLAKIDEGGNAVFKNIEGDRIDVSAAEISKIYLNEIIANEGGIHFYKAEGAVFVDNKGGINSDGSRKLVFGVYTENPELDSNYMPTSVPNAGIRARVESDENGNGTYLEIYGDNIVCRNKNAEFKAATVKADTIRANTNLKIGSASVADLIAAKANGEHTHSLTEDDITGTLPLTKGGTGATTAAAARTNLGLGTAALKGVSTSVVSGSTNLITSAAVYTALSNLNINNRTHVVVATYDTKNPLKANADYTCTSTNATSVLKTAINAVAKGGRVELLDGTYNLQYDDDPIELTGNITIEGAGHITAIHQPADTDAGEAKPLFTITGQNVILKNMMLCDSNISSPVEIISQQAQGAIYDGVFFIFNASETSGDSGCICGKNDCSFTRIQNCRVFKGFNNANVPMFDFSLCTSFGGIIGANISSGYNAISVKFASESHKSNGISNSDTYVEPTDFIATNDTSKKLTVNATAENNVSGYLGETTDSGYRFYQGLNMNGTGSRFYRSVAFDVPKNADIYITARCSSGTKNLYVTNKYECNLEDFDGVLTDSKFPLSENTKTYRIRYRGNGEKIYLKSEKDSIRFYKIEVVGTSDKIINDQKWVFDEYNELSIGNNLYDNTIDNLQIKSNSSRPASVVASSEEGFIKAIRMTSSHFDEASKLIFDISDSSDNSSAATIRSNRVIRVKAKGTATDTRLILGNQYGYVYGCYNLTTDLNEYVFNYNGKNEKLYLFTNNLNSIHYTSEIYSISTSDLQIGGPISISSHFFAGIKYKYNFTVDYMPNTEEYYYSIKYDSDKLTLLNIGKDYNNETVITDSNIQVISNQPGEIRFRILNLSEENWSGLVTSAVFTANVSGSSPIKFSVIRG